jgi:orsellinic acid C2-O-methyltransferase
MNSTTAEPVSQVIDAELRVQLRALIDASWTTQAIAAAVQLRLPEMLADAPQSAQDLARQAACHPPSLLRLLRALTSIGILVQHDGVHFSLTDMGRLLRSDAPGSLAAWAELCGTASWAGWSRLRECVQSGQSVSRQSGGDDGFEHLQRDAASALLFNRAMVGLSRSVAAVVVRELDFGGVSRIVDVGGGFGELLAAILCTHPRMQGVLFDMAHAIQVAHEHVGAAGVAGRCELVTGSFFESVPAGADAYLLKSILHDWGDEPCATLLAVCARAMPPHAKLLILERVMPERFSVSAHDQGIARMDLNMLVRQGGQERTLEQYRALLASAGLRLEAVQVLSGGFSALSAAHP